MSTSGPTCSPPAVDWSCWYWCRDYDVLSAALKAALLRAYARAAEFLADRVSFRYQLADGLQLMAGARSFAWQLLAPRVLTFRPTYGSGQPLGCAGSYGVNGGVPVGDRYSSPVDADLVVFITARPAVAGASVSTVIMQQDHRNRPERGIEHVVEYS